MSKPFAKSDVIEIMPYYWNNAVLLLRKLWKSSFSKLQCWRIVSKRRKYRLWDALYHHQKTDFGKFWLLGPMNWARNGISIHIPCQSHQRHILHILSIDVLRGNLWSSICNLQQRIRSIWKSLLWSEHSSIQEPKLTKGLKILMRSFFKIQIFDWPVVFSVILNRAVQSSVLNSMTKIIVALLNAH